ncbi:MAG: PqqD family protein [Chloroflexi bacterium]|nr:PqqD family protein [Chloroflexota bacterium]
MDWTSPIVAHDQVAARVVDGAAVIVTADAGDVMVLNQVGTRIWELIDGARSADHIAQVIAREYAVSDAHARDDVAEFLQKLIAAHAIVFRSAASDSSK